jgi:hypothetical protein
MSLRGVRLRPAFFARRNTWSAEAHGATGEGERHDREIAAEGGSETLRCPSDSGASRGATALGTKQFTKQLTATILTAQVLAGR